MEKRILTMEQQFNDLNDSLKSQSEQAPLLEKIRDLNQKYSDTTRKLQLLELEN